MAAMISKTSKAGSTRKSKAGSTRKSKAGSTRKSKAGSTRKSKAGSTRKSKAGSTRKSKAGSTRKSKAGSTRKPKVPILTDDLASDIADSIVFLAGGNWSAGTWDIDTKEQNISIDLEAVLDEGEDGEDVYDEHIDNLTDAMMQLESEGTYDFFDYRIEELFEIIGEYGVYRTVTLRF